jgi:hypothetical protein
MKKYYFICYSQRVSKESHRCSWNDVIDKSPMAFLLEMRGMDDKDSYWDTLITSVIEITEQEFNEYNGRIS